MRSRSLLSASLLIVGALGLSMLLASVTPLATNAQTSTTDIQAQIDAHNQQIANLEKEIAQYQSQLNVLGGQHQTLQTAISSIDVSRQQAATQLQVTQNKMSASTLKLQQLSGEISQKEYQIALDKRSLAQALRDRAEADNVTIIEQVLNADNLTDAWVAADDLAQVSDALRANADALAGVKRDLSLHKQDESSTRDQLAALNTQLAAQKKQLDIARSEKDALLKQTKNKESNYQSIIAQKRAQEAAFEKQLDALANQLKSVSAGSIPTTGGGILAWPITATTLQSCAGKSGALGNAHCITQYFGNTAFAQSGAYNGSGHNGIDIGLPSGTPITAALTGTVIGTGNTDLSHDAAGNQCYSFGKWVAIKHANGLATVYAHLSQVGVSSGQSVSTGQVIGYSGMTGYATGPHLHFGVYASAGIQIMTLGQFKGASSPCANATMPVAPLNAYLNPIQYL